MRETYIKEKKKVKGKEKKKTNANYDDDRETNVCAREKAVYVYLGVCVYVAQLYLRPCDLKLVEETFFVACIQRERVNGTLPSGFACALSDQARALQMVMLR